MRISRIILSIVVMLSMVAGVMLVSAQEDTAAQPFLGINIEPADDGAAVLRVLPDSPAALAGLERGDIITAVNGEAIDADTLAAVVGALSVGDEVSLDVMRNDETMQLTATLGEMPEHPANRMFPFGDFQVQRAYLGVSLESTDDGVSIAAVSETSPAAEAGLQVGDIITAVNSEAVAEPADVAAAIRDLAIGDSVTLSITRDGEAQDIEVTLGSMMNQMSTMLGDAVVYDGENWQVLSLSEDNALAAAGVQAGDVITAIDGNVYDPSGLNAYLDGLADDATVTLTIERNGETQDITVNAADLDALNAFGFGFGRRGEGMPGFGFDGPRGQFNFAPGTVRLGVAYEDQDNGALINEVVADSPAAEAGLQAGDVVTAVNGDPVDAERTLRERLLAYDPGDTITLDVLRDGETMSTDVTLAEVSMSDMMGEFPFGEEFHHFFGPDGDFNFPMPDAPRQPQTPNANV